MQGIGRKQNKQVIFFIQKNTSEQSETPNNGKELEDYRSHLAKVMEGNSDRFEKQLSYISAGSLGISMAFIKDIVGSLQSTAGTNFLLYGWICMGVTLLINLVSQVYANYCHAETIGEIDDKCFDTIIANNRRNKIQYMNYFSMLTLFAGIGLLLYFISKNI
jgi:hypothetical protein